MRALLDVNVLLALFDPLHVHHSRVHAWWQRHRNTGWASCPITQNGFVRVVSQPRYSSPVDSATAIRFLQTVTQQEDHEFWPDSLSIADGRHFRHDHVLGPRHVTDVYLVGLAVAHGGRLATLDRKIPYSVVSQATKANVAVI